MSKEHGSWQQEACSHIHRVSALVTPEHYGGALQMHRYRTPSPEGP